MLIKLNPDALRTALQALKTLYAGEIDAYYSVENNKMNIESVGGTHRFLVQFAVEGDTGLTMQKTTVGTLTQLLALLGEYSDLHLTDAAIADVEGSTAHALTVTKKLKEDKDKYKDCMTISKTMLVTTLPDGEKNTVLQSREKYTGEVLFECPAAIQVAAHKAHILKADGLYLRGKMVYCSSGDGVCRVSVPELADDLVQDLDAEFTYGLVRLGAEKYDFYAEHVVCEVNGVTFYLGIPKKAVTRELSADVLNLFDTIQADDVRVYGKEVRSIHGMGPLKIMPNKTMLLDNKVKVGAPYILPLKDTIFQVGEAHAMRQQSVTVSQPVFQAAGDEWTLGIGLVKNNRVVAKVSGDCDILFNAYS